ncbi:MAG TPA: class I SAM-dependent methyltransferase [Pyrinomonadaceae bacterium]|jgi:SAM-dependent methyltransferase
MFEPSLSIAEAPLRYSPQSAGASVAVPLQPVRVGPSTVISAIQRRWQRERRRRKVGRAFDMALEIARVLPANSRLLDVGCGNGYIAHHLSSLLGTTAIGIDLAPATEAAIDYRQFDGETFPVADNSVDAVLLCYVLHHAQKVETVLTELRRVLSVRGLAVVYEDIPAAWWDRFICWTHDLKWRKRTGPCTFRDEREWRKVFQRAGLEIVSERALSRGRNFAHPVRRRLYVLTTQTHSGPTAEQCL